MAKVLLVEDDPLMVRMYQRKLLSDGYEVEVAINGEEGLLKTRSFNPDLMLLDIMMPKLNGLQVLERMKSDPVLSKIPVIILTNLGGSQEDIERGLELGAVAYLVKSAYRPDQVLAKVKEVLAGYTRSKEVPTAAPDAAAQKVKEETSAFRPAAEAVQPKATPPPSQFSQSDVISTIRDLLQKQVPSAAASEASQPQKADFSKSAGDDVLNKLRELLAGGAPSAEAQKAPPVPAPKPTESDIVAKLKELLMAQTPPPASAKPNSPQPSEDDLKKALAALLEKAKGK